MFGLEGPRQHTEVLQLLRACEVRGASAELGSQAFGQHRRSQRRARQICHSAMTFPGMAAEAVKGMLPEVGKSPRHHITGSQRTAAAVSKGSGPEAGPGPLPTTGSRRAPPAVRRHPGHPEAPGHLTVPNPGLDQVSGYEPRP